MARMFMINPFKCIMFILLVISFYSCSTTKQAALVQPTRIDSPPHKTTSPAKTSVKKNLAKTAPPSEKTVQKADTPPVRKKNIASAKQTQANPLARKPITQAEFNSILEKSKKDKVTKDAASSEGQNIVQENDDDLMSEHLFQHSFGYSFGNSNHIAEKIKEEIEKEMLASGFNACCGESDKTLYESDETLYGADETLYGADESLNELDISYSYENDSLEEDSAEEDSAEEDSSADDWQFYSQYSKKWGLNLDGTEDKQLIMAIDEWLGTRYKWGGCSKYGGVDCSCLVKSIYEEVYGIELSRSSSSIFYNDLIPVKKEELQEGDLICFKGKKNRISHIGLYLKDDKFVHSSRSKGVTIGDLGSGYYKKIFFSGGRVTEKRMSLKMSKQFK